MKTLFAVLTLLGVMLAMITRWERKARSTIAPPYRDVKIHLNLHHQTQGMAHHRHSFNLEYPPDESLKESPFCRDGEEKPWFHWLHFDKDPPTQEYVSTRI